MGYFLPFESKNVIKNKKELKKTGGMLIKNSLNSENNPKKQGVY
jgi:hypothetical protein